MASRLSNNLIIGETPYKNPVLQRESPNSNVMIGGTYEERQARKEKLMLDQGFTQAQRGPTFTVFSQPNDRLAEDQTPIENKSDFEKSFAQGLAETQNKAITNLIFQSRGIYTSPFSYMKNRIDSRSRDSQNNTMLGGSFSRMMR